MSRETVASSLRGKSPSSAGISRCTCNFATWSFYSALIWVVHTTSVQGQIMSQWLPNALRTIQFDVWADPEDGSPAMGPPIVVGTSLTLDCCSRFARNGREFYRGYQMFVDWTNMVRGGVSVQGEMRSIQLTLIDDHSSVDLVREITEHLVENGTEIFLAPFSSTLTEPAADVVNSSGGVMLAGGSSYAHVYEDRPYIFSTHRPAHLWFAGTFIAWRELGVKSVVAIQEEPSFTRAVCSGLAGLAQKYDMSLVSVLTIPSGANISGFVSSHLGSLQELPDVLVGCTYEDACKDVLRGLQFHNINFRALAFTTCVTSSDFLSELGDIGRFVIGLTPWMSSFPMTSDITGWRSSDFETIYKERYKVEPPYQAVMAFIAGISLVASIEAANSTEPAEIAAALQAMKRQSLIGDLSFNDYGMTMNDMKAVQFQATGETPLLVSPSITSKMVYPMPPWDDRACFDAKRNSSEVGLERFSMRCQVCPLGELSWWKQDAWYGSPAWQCVPIDCRLGFGGLKDGSCEVCMPGKYGTSVDCVECPLGKFSGTAGASACAACPLGKFANPKGQTACKVCSPGYEASREGLFNCRPCRPGTNSSKAGAVNCELCKEGTISNTSASKTCISCEPGRYSAWGAQSCDACQKGRYQEASEQSSCDRCPSGTSCKQEGTSIAANSPDWWALNYTKDGTHYRSWHACTNQGFCLADERCATGHTGLICKACLPGYSFNALSKACTSCPLTSVNLLSCTVLAVAICIFTLFLTAWSIMAATQAKAITSALLKLLLNYITTMSIMGTVLYRELSTKMFFRSYDNPDEAREDSLMEWPKFFSAQFLSFQSSVFSLECLLEPSLSNYELEIVNQLADVPHSSFLLPEYSQARNILRDFHHELELRRAVFWVVLPFLLSAFLILFGALRLKLFLSCNRAFLHDAAIFVHEIDNHGWKSACRAAQKKGHDYHKFLSLYERRLMGIWRAIDYRGHRGRKWFSKFRKECEPLVLIIFFLAYPYCMKAFLRPLSCVKPLGGLFGSRMESAIDVECYNNDKLFWLSLFLITFFGLGLPIGSGFLLFEHREKLHKPRFQRTYGFLTGGYEVDRNYWECGILVRKSVSQLVASLGMNQGIRILLVITASSTFTLLHIWYQPFDNRFDELLDRIEFRHLICWVTFGLLLLGMHMMPADAPPETYWIFLIFLVLVHVSFLLMILGHVARHARNNYAEKILGNVHHEQYRKLHHEHLQKLKDGEEHGDMEESEMKMLPGEVLQQQNLPCAKRLILRRYKNYLDQQAYVAFHNEKLWCQILGNMGSACVVPESFIVLEADPGITSMKTEMPFGVELSSEKSRLYMVKIIMEVFEYVIVNQEISVFSSTLLEFVFRAGLAFGSDGKQRHVYVSHSSSTSQSQGSSLTDFASAGNSVVEAAGGAVTKVAAVARDSVNSAVGVFKKSATKSGDLSRANSDSLDSKGSGPSDLSAELDDDEVRDAGRALEKELRHGHMSNEKLMRGTTQDTIISAIAKQEAQYESAELVKLMFEPSIFKRGLTLQEFQLNLAASVMTKTKRELRMWFEVFEAEWQRRKLEAALIQEEIENPHEEEVIETADSATQVCASDIILEYASKSQVDLGPTCFEAHWHRFARRMLLSAGRQAARQPALHMIVKNQRRLAPIHEKEAALESELADLNEELERLRNPSSGADVELLRVRNQLASARSEHAQVTKEVLQLREECKARGIEIPASISSSP